MSDCWAIIDIYAHHKVVDTPAEAAALAVIHGCDLNCGSTYPALNEAVTQSLISEAVIDQAVKRLFTARMRLGMFDPPEQNPYAQIPFAVVDSAAHHALALRAARESMVLLKNDDQTLPLSKDLKSIAVIGPNADSYAVLLGNYNGTPTKAVTPLEAIKRKVAPDTRVYYAQGCSLADGVPPLLPIPTQYLRPAEAKAGETGLTAVYYDNPQLEGDPAVTKVDPMVDFIWCGTTPLTGQWGDYFAIGWTGYLVPPQDGTYLLGVNGFSAYRLYLDDDLLVEFEEIHHPITKTKAVSLEGGRHYKLRLDYVSQGRDPQIQLLWAPPTAGYEAQAMQVAEKADVIVAVMGLSPLLEGEEMPVEVEGFSGGDRTDIQLPRPQMALLQHLHRLGKPMILTLLNGSTLAFNWASDHLPAIVEAWYPGQAGGEALADVLFGDYNPAGRLPVTFYQSVADLPPFDDYAMAGRTYRYFTGEPRYAFGYGLSYTTFTYDNLQLSAQSVAATDTITVMVDVENTGSRDGDEVVQLYVRACEPGIPRPIQELKGLHRISLQVGQTQTVSFTLAIESLGFYDEALNWVVEPGLYEVRLGSASDNILLTAEIHLPSCHPSLLAQ